MGLLRLAGISAFLSFSIFIFSSAGARAQTVNPTPNTGQFPAPEGQHNHPHMDGHMMAAVKQNPSCQNILNECKKIGFVEGEWKQDNGVWKDCFGPIVKGKGSPTRNGQPVTVPVSQSDVQACKAALPARKSK